jgi:excisionase family DNA binding protein
MELQHFINRIESRLEQIERHLKIGVARQAYTVAQAAERLGLSEWTVRQACNKGRIHASKARNGREWRIPHDELVRVEAEGLPRHD